MRQLNTLAFTVAISILLSCCNNNQTGNNQKAANDKQGTATPDSVMAQIVSEGFVSPVYLTQAADDNRLFVVDQPGQVFIIKDGQKLAQPFLDIKNKIVQLKPEHEERGLLIVVQQLIG